MLNNVKPHTSSADNSYRMGTINNKFYFSGTDANGTSA
jgi:hypothetical protein